ncbi:DUF3558 domain-containing protein [Amycolatopsis sp.]|uniref:DUF3558 domain-containing protein n=1 Tax=Amycolatopsis sp. TaxID=37632 RepID=UPI002DFF3A41|nr:DUF3558 domain-containing protein [Amycolatopsis sp.]
MSKVIARPALLLLVVGAFGLAGCSSSEIGTAVPSTGLPSSGQPQPSPTAPPESSTQGGSAGTASVQPCSLLSATDLTEYGTFNGPDEKELGGARTCGFQRKLASASDKGLGVSINVRDKQGISSVNDLGQGIQTDKLNGRDVVRAPSTNSACTIALAVGDTSRVDVLVTADSTAEACDVAAKLVGVVEPKLPKG